MKSHLSFLLFNNQVLAIGLLVSSALFLSKEGFQQFRDQCANMPAFVYKNLPCPDFALWAAAGALGVLAGGIQLIAGPILVS
jgi:hypothetical protein